jgi:hypothetical protein
MFKFPVAEANIDKTLQIVLERKKTILAFVLVSLVVGFFASQPHTSTKQTFQAVIKEQQSTKFYDFQYHLNKSLRDSPISDDIPLDSKNIIREIIAGIIDLMDGSQVYEYLDENLSKYPTFEKNYNSYTEILEDSLEIETNNNSYVLRLPNLDFYDIESEKLLQETLLICLDRIKMVTIKKVNEIMRVYQSDLERQEKVLANYRKLYVQNKEPDNSIFINNQNINELILPQIETVYSMREKIDNLSIVLFSLEQSDAETWANIDFSMEIYEEKKSLKHLVIIYSFLGIFLGILFVLFRKPTD